MFKPRLPVIVSMLLVQPLVYADNTQALSSANHFNPQISLILDGNYYHDNQQGAHGATLENMAGIGHGVHFGAEEAGLEQGFNLGESELMMSAIVDPYFDGQMNLTVSADGEVALEESWLQTRLLPDRKSVV